MSEIMETSRYYGYASKTCGALVEGHDVAIEFDKKLLVINQVRLFVDGSLVDADKVWYGDKELSVSLDDGSAVNVVIDSGMIGELTRAQARRSDGTLIDLRERAGQPNR
ncbi:MAG: hypothetical protein QOG60_2029 [Frankiaceae bacterium]|jgi:hypothetical protein|nr:hypothetical protein [Frankiaceae bacterium]